MSNDLIDSGRSLSGDDRGVGQKELDKEVPQS